MFTAFAIYVVAIIVVKIFVQSPLEISNLDLTTVNLQKENFFAETSVLVGLTEKFERSFLIQSSTHFDLIIEQASNHMFLKVFGIVGFQFFLNQYLFLHNGIYFPDFFYEALFLKNADMLLLLGFKHTATHYDSYIVVQQFLKNNTFYELYQIEYFQKNPLFLKLLLRANKKSWFDFQQPNFKKINDQIDFEKLRSQSSLTIEQIEFRDVLLEGLEVL